MVKRTLSCACYALSVLASIGFTLTSNEVQKGDTRC
jgi:hypothetical protein